MKTDIFKEALHELSKKNRYLDKFILPEYSKGNVKNINVIVKRIFGQSNSATPNATNGLIDDFNKIEKVLLLIVDGFGYKQLLSHVEKSEGLFWRIIKEGKLAPLTTVFPSTTATVLTSLFTGLSPAEHGIIGYQMFSRKYGVVFNTLNMKPVYGYNREVLLTQEYLTRLKPWMRVLEEGGVSTYISTESRIARDGLSQIIYGDCKLLPYHFQSDMLVGIRKTLEQQDRVLIMGYYSGVDNISHKYGPHSEEADFEIESLESSLMNMISKLSSKTKQKTLVLITSDHGVAEVDRTYYLGDFPNLTNRLMFPPTGDSRATFLSPNLGEELRFAEEFNKSIVGIRLFDTKKLIDDGAFGNPENAQQLTKIIGSCSALSEEKSILQYPFYEQDRDRKQLGAHGGMTEEEIIIPLLSIRLSKLPT